MIYKQAILSALGFEGADCSNRRLFSIIEILVGKGILDSNCPTYDCWVLNLSPSMMTI